MICPKESKNLPLNGDDVMEREYETGRGIPDRTNMRQLANALNVSVEELNKVCEGIDVKNSNELITPTALGLGEKSICDVDRLNMGLYLLGDIVTKAVDKIEADERT